MPTPLSPKKLRVYDAMPVGSVIRSPLDFEAMTNGQWVALDGRDLYRSQYPEVAKFVPAGVATNTARTLNVAPGISCYGGASDGTNFVIAGSASSASALQYSSNGVSWTNTGDWGATTSAACIIHNGIRFIAGGGGDLAQPYVTANTANPSAKANWTATTGGTWTGGIPVQGFAYSPSLALTVGIGVTSATTNINTLADGATAWTQRTASTALPKTCVIWTGQKFICFAAQSNAIQTSVDGTNWVDEFLPFYRTSGSGSAVSDGAGTIVLPANVDSSGYTFAGFKVSKDHGATWRTVNIAGMNTPSSYAYFLNGKFVVGTTCTNSGAMIRVLTSLDGIAWNADTTSRGLNSYPHAVNAFAFNKTTGTYLSWFVNGGSGGSTTAYTAVDDMSKFVLPEALSTYYTAVGFQPPDLNLGVFMKVRSS